MPWAFVFFIISLDRRLCIKLTNYQLICVCMCLCVYEHVWHWLRCQRSVPGVYLNCTTEAGSVTASGNLELTDSASWPRSPCGLPISAYVSTRVIDVTPHSWHFTWALEDLDSDKLLTGSFPQPLDKRNLTLMWKIKYVELFTQSLQTLPSHIG